MSDLVIGILIIVGYLVGAILLYSLLWVLAEKGYVRPDIAIDYSWATALWPFVLFIAPFYFVIVGLAQGGVWLFLKAFKKIIPEKKKKKNGDVSVR